MKKLYFARHGLTVMNVEGKFAGTTDTPLTAKGREQAKQAGRQAKELDIDYIACSPLDRAKETAKIIAKEIGYPVNKIHINPMLIERHFGKMEGQPYHADMNLDGIAEVETAETIILRAKFALQWLHSIEAEHILVISHGSFGRALRSQMLKDVPFHGSGHLSNAELHQWL